MYCWWKDQDQKTSKGRKRSCKTKIRLHNKKIFDSGTFSSLSLIMTLPRFLKVGTNGARILSSRLSSPSRSLMQTSSRWTRPSSFNTPTCAQKLSWSPHSSLQWSFKRAMSTTTTTASEASIASGKSTLVKVTKPIVGYWLYFNAGLVFAIVVVGGLTRLTESGLSITEWNVISGMKPPRSESEWIEEFEKYKQFPEYKMYVPCCLEGWGGWDKSDRNLGCGFADMTD